MREGKAPGSMRIRSSSAKPILTSGPDGGTILPLGATLFSPQHCQPSRRLLSGQPNPWTISELRIQDGSHEEN